ncbi:nickel transporter permease NikC [Thermoplasmatales archaeon]|nr:nickel transporter permease NikC [Thermoplasmatales archaeon]
MDSNNGNGEIIEIIHEQVKGSSRSNGIRTFISNKYLFVGSIIIIAVFVFSIYGYFFPPYNPNASFASNLPPSSTHLLGTNFFGNDILSDYMVSIIPTLEIALVGAALALLVAVVVGLFGGYFSGIKNEVLAFFINVFLLIPGLPLAIVISSGLEASHSNLGVLSLAIVIIVTGWAFGARTIRAQAMSIAGRDYIRFIKHTGESDFRIIFREVLPSLLSYIGYVFTNLIIFAILLETSLLFLGLGNESIISLGSILYFANNYSAILLGEWWWFIPPGLTIAIIGVGFGLISLGLDTIANPSLRTYRNAKKYTKTKSVSVMFSEPEEENP